MFIRKKKGQSILEYAVFLGVIIAVIIVMQIYVKRAIQGKFKSNADQLGEQFTTGEYNTVQTITQTARKEDYQESSLADGTVQKSEIQGAGDAAWATGLGSYVKKADDYKGAEISTTDNVVQASALGNQVVGTHTINASGVLKDKKLFGDDDPE